MKLTRLLLGMTALVPVSAYAQQSEPLNAATAGDTGAAEGNDIIVTARKTSERLQDVPVAVSVATAAIIENLNLNNLNDIAKITPGLTFDDSQGRGVNRPIIRGQANILGQSGVAFFIDGIYYTGTLADYDVDSIDRLEVVKGPQSALYGRNTYSGAINIISKAPGTTWEGNASADISENDRYEVTAGVRGPIAQGLGVAINGRYYDYGGEFTNAFDGTKLGQQSSWSASGLVKYDNGGAFRASLRGYYNRTDDGQPAIFSQSPNANNCFTDNGALYRGQGRYFCGVIQPQQPSSDYRRQFVDPENVGLEANTFNGALRLDADLAEGLTLTSLTGYNKRTANQKTDGDYTANSFQLAILAFTPAPAAVPVVTGRNRVVTLLATSVQDFTFSTHNETDDWSQELRLDYEGNGFRAFVGGYYFRQNDDTNDTRVVPPGSLARAQANADAARAALCAQLAYCASVSPLTLTAANLPESRNINNMDIRNQAIFGSLSVDLTNALSITAEGRYASEKIKQSTQTFNNGAVAPVPAVVSATFKKFVPRVTVDYKVAPNNLLYATYAEGQKPGGFNSNQAIVAGLPTFDPETVKSYEFGSKNSFFGGALTANLAIFHNEIRGYQITQSVSVPPNQVSVTRNGGNAQIEGGELSLLFRPDRHLTVTANYALADGKFTNAFDENFGLLQDVADNGLVDCSTGDQFPLVAGCQSLYGNVRGKQIPRAPKHTAFADVDWRHPVGSGDWSVFAGGNVTLTDSNFDQVFNLAKTGGSTVVDLRAGFQSSRFKIQGYVRNLFDEDSVPEIIRYADANADLRRNFIAGLRPGRRIGVVLTGKF